jgi:hypothetical protein
MSFWQLQAAIIGVHRANNPDDENTPLPPPSPDELMAALEGSLVH